VSTVAAYGCCISSFTAHTKYAVAVATVRCQGRNFSTFRALAVWIFIFYFYFLDTIFGGFTVFHCDTTLDVHECTEAAPFFLIALAQRRDPQGAQAGNRTQDLPNGR